MKKQFMSRGIFEQPFMNSRIKTASMTRKEKLLGYLAGPFGTLALMAVVNQLAELYYTEIFYIDQIFGVGTYLVMSWVTRIVAVLSGFVVAYIVENSVSSQGRIRPILLIGALISAVGGFFMFFIPEMPDPAKLVWVYVFSILYNGIGVTMFSLRANMYTLCTRDQNDRNQINVIVQTTAYLIVGTAVTLVVGSVLYYTFLTGQPASHWITLVGGFALLSIPFSLVQYYYTIERITLENMAVGQTISMEEKSVEFSEENKKNLWTQVKYLLTSKYWILGFLFTTVVTLVGNLNGYNLSTNFCNVILGATAENNYNLLYTVASGIPMGLGILLVYPLAKKFTIRKTTIAFSVLCIVGCVIGYIAKTSFWPVVAANFVYNFGTLPVIYVIGALINSTNDEVEYKHGFRPEGTIAVALLMCLSTLVTGLFAGVYETGLSAFGYDAAAGTAQPEGVINWLYFIRYGVQIVQYTLIIVIVFFLDLESKLPAMQSAIHQRHKEKAKAAGETWISPGEL